MARQITALAAQPGVHKVLGDAEVRGGGIAYPQTHATIPTSFTKGRLGRLGRLVACGSEVTAIVARLAWAAISPQRAPVAPARRLGRLPAPTNARPTPTHPERPSAARPPVKNADATVSKTAALAPLKRDFGLVPHHGRPRIWLRVHFGYTKQSCAVLHSSHHHGRSKPNEPRRHGAGRPRRTLIARRYHGLAQTGFAHSK